MKNNKLLIILPIMFLLVLTLVSAIATAPDHNNVLGYWALEDLTDKVSSHSITNTGSATSGATGIIDNAYDFESSNTEYITISDHDDFSFTDGSGNDQPFTISYWVKHESLSDYQSHISKWLGNKEYYELTYASGQITFGLQQGSSYIGRNTGANAVTVGSWYHVVITYDGSELSSGLNIYVNGIDKDISNFQAGAYTGMNNGVDDVSIGARGTALSFDGILDELMFDSVEWGQDEIDYIYNSGSPTILQQYDFTDSSSFSITAKDFYDDTSINIFNATIDGTLYQTTNGTIHTNLFQNDTNTYTLEVEPYNYFDLTITNLDITTNYEAVLKQSKIRFKPYEMFTDYYLDPTIYDANYTIDGVKKTAYEYFYLSEGEYTVLAEVEGYYSQNHTFNVTALQDNYTDITNFYDSKVTVNLKDVLTGSIIAKNSTLNITNHKSGNTDIYTSTDGTINFDFITGTYNITYFATDYATTQTNFTINATTQEFNYSLYANNSVWVYAFDTDTGAVLTNFDVEIYDANSTYSTNETGGYATFEDIPSGVYTVSITRSGYTSAEYSLTMTGGSHQTLNAYLSPDTASTVDFTTTDLISGSTKEGVDISQYRTVTGSWTLVSNQETDLTGRARFSYTSGIEYKFIFSLTGYETRIIYLEPLFTSYTVRLTSDSVEEPDSKGYFITSTPNLFYDEAENNLSITLSSASGTIQNYTISIIAPNVEIINTYTNANGGEHNYDFNITGSTISDRLKIIYTVQETGKSSETRTYFYLIENRANIDGFFKTGDIDTGMGDFEKGLLATFILLIVTTIVAIGSNYAGINPLIPTGLSFILFLVLFSVIGFIPLWSVYISGLALFLIIIFSLRDN